MDKFAASQMLKLKNSLIVKEEKDSRYIDFLFFLRKKKKEGKRK